MSASVEKILESVDNSLDRIKQFTRIALQSDPSKVVALWREELSRRLLISQDALPLVYCCNDVLQESRGEQNEAFRLAFSEILEDDLRAILRENPASLELIRKVLTVWSERQVFDKSYTKKLKRCLYDFRDGELCVHFDHIARTNKQDFKDHEPQEQEDAVSEHEEATQEDPHELQRKALESLPLAKVVALASHLKANEAEDTQLNESQIDTLKKKVRDALEGQSSVEVLKDFLSQLQGQIELLSRKRQCVQGRIPATNAAFLTLQKSIEKAENSLQDATDDLSQSEAIASTINTILSHSNGPTVELKYGSIRLLPKREKVVKQVAQGPDLSFSKERVLKEGLTAEAAVKTERPMVYHKGLQKWVPLPTGDDVDNWRD